MLKMKQCISLLLVLCVMLVVAPLTAYAATGGSCGENVTWSINEDGVLTISGTGPMEDYDVDYAPWFDNLDLVSSAKIENGVTTIGAYAFEFSDITNVEIPDSVTSIGQGAFGYCIELGNVEIPDSVTIIGGYAFSGSTNLTSVEIPDNVTTIGESAFRGCESLSSVKFYGNVPEIGEDAFLDVTATAYYPANNPTWTEDVMDSYGGTITWVPYGSCGENVTWSLSDDGVLTISGTGPMEDNFPTPWYDYRTLISSVIIENGVTTIGYAAFHSCDGLVGVEIPDSITIISNQAFLGCERLISVEIPDSVTGIGNAAFENCQRLTDVEIPNSVTTIGDSAFSGCESLIGVEIPGSVTGIGDFAFYGCKRLTDLEIPDSVTTIGDSVFSGCKSLTSMEIPDSVTSIGDYAFAICESLSSVEIPNSVTDIGRYAFLGCSSLSSVKIGDSVTTIGDSAFSYCYDLTSVIFYGEAPEIELDAFLDVTATAYYPSNNPTWTLDVMDDYGGTITWVPYASNPFSDVPAGAFYEAPVIWAVENGVTTGATENTFDPNGACLRAHVVTFLHRAAGNPEPSSSNNPFADVASGSFFYKPVLWAVENSITNGTSATTFGSYDNCNRAAVVTFLWRAAGSPEPKSTDNPFVDVATDAFYYKAVLWAVENGITNGVDATHFGPTANCTRAQVVTFLYRTYKQ